MELKATQERCILAMGCHVWGKGKTEAQAIRNWRKEAYAVGGKKIKLNIIDAPAEFAIDDFGTILRHDGSPPSVLLKTVTIDG